jgi:hypothetical protein
VSKNGEVRVNIYFSDLFNIPSKVIQEFGALDVSLVNDLPFFVDPFLLFHSEKSEYQDLHSRIIRYLEFLREESAGETLPSGLIADWSMFSEIKQTWLGFSRRGNHGRGLGRDFATRLHANLRTVFTSFGNEQITEGTHLEKLCLIQGGVGRDNISDFSTNLIKEYLCEFSQRFAKEHLHPSQTRLCAVKKAAFNYTTKAWVVKRFNLPFINGDYVLLTPRDMLTKGRKLDKSS